VTVDGDLVARLRAAGCVFAGDEARLLLGEAASPSELAALLARRESGEPLEQVLGWVEFCGRRVHVAPGVFVPRRRTEWLVSCAAAVTPAGAVLVELCCGVGAVARVLGEATRCRELHAADIDPIAVACAKRNLDSVGGEVWCGDLYDALPGRLRGRIDVLVANAPYVPSSDVSSMPREAREHEPLHALDGGSDGVDVQRRIASAAGDWLSPRGHLLVETSGRQGPLTVAAFRAGGLAARVERDEELDATVVIGSHL
jgi:release factor glutamine methyltransferase